MVKSLREPILFVSHDSSTIPRVFSGSLDLDRGSWRYRDCAERAVAEYVLLAAAPVTGAG
jgi:ABC-type polysaccharide/polyol phosphate transport system ATPase subunit